MWEYLFPSDIGILYSVIDVGISNYVIGNGITLYSVVDDGIQYSTYVRIQYSIIDVGIHIPLWMSE